MLLCLVGVTQQPIGKPEGIMQARCIRLKLKGLFEQVDGLVEPLFL